MTGASGHRRVPISFYESIKIPVPPIEVQKDFVKEIEKLEEKIFEAQKVINNAASQKQAILKKYL
jgi:type I restriction enzyme S subunit